MRALALTFGPESCASSHYRIFQYRELWAKAGIELISCPANEFSDWKILGDFDLVIVQKRLFRRSIVRRLKANSRRLVYDVDDAVWLPHGKPHHPYTRWRTMRRLGAIARASDLCIAANDLLKIELEKHSKHVEVVPMALDPDVWTAAERNGADSICVGWIGSPSNLSYLEAIEDDLTRLQDAHPNVEIKVFCGAPPRFKNGLRHSHIPYQPGMEAKVARTFDIGLLPLPNDEFAARKSPIKALHYMASGVVTVASPVGATRDMIDSEIGGLYAEKNGGWYESLSRLVRNSELRANLSASARRRFESQFTNEVTARQLIEHFQTVAK